MKSLRSLNVCSEFLLFFSFLYMRDHGAVSMSILFGHVRVLPEQSIFTSQATLKICVLGVYVYMLAFCRVDCLCTESHFFPSLALFFVFSVAHNTSCCCCCFFFFFIIVFQFLHCQC